MHVMERNCEHMAHRATLVSQDPLNYFLQPNDIGPYLRVSDVALRVNLNPIEIFSRIIRFATNSAWSHTAMLYLISDPLQGYDNTFLVEALTSGIHVASWRNEVFPFETFTVGIRRLPLDWYAETPHDIARHDPHDPEDTPGIAYLRHVRGMALDQVNGLYDENTIFELVALYAERVAKRHFAAIPEIAAAAESAADLFRRWDESDANEAEDGRSVCIRLIPFPEEISRLIGSSSNFRNSSEMALGDAFGVQGNHFKDGVHVIQSIHLVQCHPSHVPEKGNAGCVFRVVGIMPGNVVRCFCIPIQREAPDADSKCLEGENFIAPTGNADA